MKQNKKKESEKLNNKIHKNNFYESRFLEKKMIKKKHKFRGHIHLKEIVIILLVLTMLIVPLYLLNSNIVGYVIVDLNASKSDATTLTNITNQTGFSHLEISDVTPYDSLISYWNFDNDTSTTAYDLTNNSNDGTYNGDAASNETGSLGYGDVLHLDSVGDYIDLNNDITFESNINWTMATWFKTSDITTCASYLVCNPIFGDDNSDTYFFHAGIDGQKVTYKNKNGGSFTSNKGATSVSDDKWHQAVFVNYENETMDIYVDGTSDIDSFSSTTSSSIIIRIIGGTVFTAFFDGSIDEVMIFNTSLTSQQVSDIYNNQSSRFKNTGELFFDDLNIVNSSAHITIEGCQVTHESNISISINDGTNEYVDETCTISGYEISGNLTAANLTMTLESGNATTNFYTPIISGDITITGTNIPTVSNVLINSTDNNLNDDSQNLTVTFTTSDSDNHNITSIYRWYNDSGLQAASILIDDSNLISYWPLDNDVFDYKGENDGTLNRDAFINLTNGKVNSSLELNGNKSYINVNDSTSLDITENLTIGAWIKGNSFFHPGNGNDGTLTVTSIGTIVNNYTYLEGNETKGNTVIGVNDSSEFSIDDEILIIQIQNGTGKGKAGIYEFKKILSISDNNLTLTEALDNTYGSGIFNTTSSSATQIVKVPQYINLIINSGASIIAPYWDGYKGGIIAIKVTNNLTVTGSINATGKGFRGGLGIVQGTGDQGESTSGIGVSSTSANVGAGGGASAPGSCCPRAGGGGGGYGIAGSNGGGTTGTPGDGGSAYGENILNDDLLFGSGGGGGGTPAGHSFKDDGDAGGGIIFIAASKLDISGNINASGQSFENAENSGQGGCGGAGGGGAIFIQADSLNLGTNLISAAGGKQVTTFCGGTNYGGAGGDGRIRLDFKSLTGSTDPTPGYNESLPNVTNVVSKKGAYSFGSNGTTIFGLINNQSISAIASTSIWTHILLTYDGANQNLYIDGTSQASISMNENININDNPIYIGTDGNYDFNGSIDEVLIFNRTLSQVEITQLYYGSVHGGNILNSDLTKKRENWTVGITPVDYLDAGTEVNSSKLKITTCRYSSGNWNIDSSDNCKITSNQNLGENNLIFTGTGYFTLDEDVIINNIDQLILDQGTIIVLGNGSKLVI